MEPEPKSPTDDTEHMYAHPPAPLLSPETEARLQSMARPYGRPSEKQAASYEERRQRIKDSRALNDQMRLEQIRAIPKVQRTEDEQREFSRLYNRQRRKAAKGKNVDVVSSITSREQFWTLNRTTAENKKIGAWKERHERVLDTLAWLDRIENGKEAPENCAENYVCLEEGLSDLLADVKEHGVTRLGYITRNEDIPTDWATGTFGKRPFWRNSEVFRMLCDESPATERWVKFGLLTALPDYRVIGFLTDRCGWEWRKTAELVGIQINHLSEAVHR